MSDQSAVLDHLAELLRGRLVADAHAGQGDDLASQVQAQVDLEVGFLSEELRLELVRRIAQKMLGLGPLDPLLQDGDVSEVMVSGTKPVWIERNGRIEQTSFQFQSEGELRHTIERILAPLGRRVDEAQPLVDARLADGSRVNVVIPPLAIDGPELTIRRFRRQGYSPRELVECGTMPQFVVEFLKRAVGAHATILICGGTGSGKTTLLNALSSFICESERIVTIEDAAELSLRQEHVVRLEARPANIEERGEVTIRTLVRNALRMRPDRIIVGEVRGGEALDLLSALSTGHEGSLSTVHAGSANEALRRIETLALMADVDLPHRAVREQVAGAFDLVVCQARTSDGSRKVTSVCEVFSGEDGAEVRALYERRKGEEAWVQPTQNSKLMEATR